MGAWDFMYWFYFSIN